jgi:protein O-GlcNAc transferase
VTVAWARWGFPTGPLFFGTVCGGFGMLKAMPARWVPLASMSMALVLASTSVFGQDAPPPLPRIAVDEFPADARAAVSRAYADAAAQPSDAAAAGALGRLLHAWEQWDGAHQAYSRAVALAPKAFEWPYLDAVVLQRLARYDEAGSRLEQALAASPDYLPARVRLAESLLDTGDLVKSGARFQALLREPAAEPAAHVGLGRIAALEGRHADAIVHFQKAITLFPELGAAYYGLALSYRALGRSDDARRALADHAKFGARWPALDDPVRDAVAALRDDAAATLQRGVRLAQSGDLPGAIAAHEAALARDPSLVQAHTNLVSLYGGSGNFAKADEHYRAAVKLGGDLGDAHYDYGVLLGQQEKWDLAADAYRKALALNPANGRARNNLGQIFERQRQFEAAAAEYRQAVESQPAFRLARFNLGRMLVALKRNDEAVVELSKLNEPRDSETPRYLFALSAAYVRAGKKDDAIKWATEARQLALEYGQKDLAAIIERDLAKLK